MTLPKNTTSDLQGFNKHTATLYKIHPLEGLNLAPLFVDQ
jgi:hypothetical protein